MSQEQFSSGKYRDGFTSKIYKGFVGLSNELSPVIVVSLRTFDSTAFLQQPSRGFCVEISLAQGKDCELVSQLPGENRINDSSINAGMNAEMSIYRQLE